MSKYTWLSTASSSELSSRETLIIALYDLGAVAFGSFILKSGLHSPLYIDLRLIISFPQLLSAVAKCMMDILHCDGNEIAYDRILGVPYTALPVATHLSLMRQTGMLMKRKEGPKAYGMKREIEGVYEKGDRVLIVEDLVTSGASVLETVAPLIELGLQVQDVVVLIDREQGGIENLNKHHLRLHAVFTITEILDVLERKRKLDGQIVRDVKEFIQNNKVQLSTPTNRSENEAQGKQYSKQIKRIPTYEDKLECMTNEAGKSLLRIIISKKTNLCVSADITKKADLLRIADVTGPYIALLKTHIDIIEDFDSELIKQLMKLAKKHNFLLFEDRKFADIGSTVQAQYAKGIYHIVDWSEITNAHVVPGSGVIDGLRSVGNEHGRGLLLIAEMSSAGSLATGDFTKAAVSMAEKNSDFVIGFIAQRQLSENMALLTLTPGVSIASVGDDLGQQYNSPENVIQQGSDIIIVGRGIVAANDPAVAAETYRLRGWNAYEKRIAL